MDPEDALDKLSTVKLPHPGEALLRSFVVNALDQRLAAQYLCQRLADDGPQCVLGDWIRLVQAVRAGTNFPTPDSQTRDKIKRRDAGRCCLTGKPGNYRDPLIVRAIISMPSAWLGGDINSEMLGAFLTTPYLNWWFSVLKDPGTLWPLSSHWLVRRSAANAYGAGALQLRRLQPSAIEYEVRHNHLGPEEPLDLNGEYPLLGDHSRCGLQTVDPRLVGTHARFSESVRLIEIARDISPGISPSLDPTIPRYQPAPPIKLFPATTTKRPLLRNLVYRSIFSVWRLFPSTIRLLAYKALRYVGHKLYGPAAGLVQRLPFGLYLKYNVGADETRNEYNAMQVLLRQTSLPVPQPLDLITIKQDPGEFGESDDAYLVMTCLPGVELSRCQTFLSDSELESICQQLAAHVSQLRRLPPLESSTDTTICNTLGEACFDPRIHGGQPVGPFTDESSFSQMLRYSDEPSRRNHKIVFTHADLNPRNILISPVRTDGGDLQWSITGIVDWATAGYYPEYWDFTKALFEGFRWPRRYNEQIKRCFEELGNYSEELDVEVRSWESGDGV